MTPKLTLICPTYQRHHYLERSCRFWRDRSEVCVLYADGSNVPMESVSVDAKNIRYLHQSISIQKRLLNLLELVRTPYVCMMSDDEFYIPSSLSSCIDFLDSNSDYVACMGRALGFSRRDSTVSFTRQYPKLQHRNLVSDLPFCRLTDHFSEYVPAHCYAVTRVDVFREAMSKALNCKLDLYAIYELIEEFIVVSKGKTCVLPELYWLRSHEAPPVRNTGDLGLDPRKRINNWWLSEDPSIVTERLAFCDELALSTKGILKPADVASIFDCYVRTSYGDHRAFSRRILNVIVKGIVKVAPVSIIDKFRNIRSLRASIKRIDPIQELCNQGVRIDEAGLAECVAAIEASWNC